MFKINNQKLNIVINAFVVLAFFAFGLMGMTGNANAQTTYDNGFHLRTKLDYTKQSVTNPSPSITSISPDSSNRGVGTKTITITGSGFLSQSVVRMNSFDRSTTFIDSEHLLVKLDNNDLVNAGTFFITVFNKAPDGGYSQAMTFTVNEENSVSTGGNINKNSQNGGANTNPEGDTFQKMGQSGSNDSQNGNVSVGSLASNTIFGSNNFMPSGIIQWILLAIIILIIVIIARKVFGGEARYHSTPLKQA